MTGVTLTDRGVTACSLGVAALDLVEPLLQRVPGQRRALDADGELHDALERFEVAEPHAFEFGREVVAVAVALELRLVDRHQRLERPDELAGVGDRQALHRRDIIDVDAWLIEQPCPAIFRSVTVSPSTSR